MSVLEDIRQIRDPFVAIADIPWDQVLPARPLALFHKIPEVAALLAEHTATGAGPLTAAGIALVADEAEAQALVLGLLRTQAAGVLGYAGGETVDPDSSLLDLGFSSFTALELSNRLYEAIGVRVPAIAVFDYPTMTSLAGHVRDQIALIPL